MNTFTKITTATLITAAVVGCSSTKQHSFTSGFEPGVCKFITNEQAPDWVCMPYDEFPNDGWYALGVSEAGEGDINFRLKVAKNNARSDLADRAIAKVDNEFLQTNEGERAGGSSQFSSVKKDVLRVSSNLVFPPTPTAAQAYDSNGNLYVLVRVDGAKVEALLKQRNANLQREFNARLKLMKNANPLSPESTSTAQPKVDAASPIANNY